MDEDLVANLVAFTGASDQVARQLLEMTAGDLDQAATLFFETGMASQSPDTATAGTTSSSANTASAARAAAVSAGLIPGSSSSSNQAGAIGSSRSARSRRTGIGREDNAGVIHIDDSDDDADMDFDDADDNDYKDDDDDSNDERVDRTGDTHMSDAATAAAASVARTAQEEEDAAMAKRLQEEMYAEPSGSAGGSDDVRAPISRTTEVLVEPSYGGYDDFSSSVYQEMQRHQQARTASNNPFSQVWGDEAANGSSANPTDAQPTTRHARLAELFRPPYDLIEHMTWDEARAVGKEEKRWILANIQDMSNFQCQALNRDIWKDEAIKQLVHENFIFLQYNKEDISAESYIQYYMPGGQHENHDNYPHIGIIDPRTGEQVKVWSGLPFPSAPEFHAQLAEFLDRYSLDLSKKNPVQRTKPQRVVKDVGRMTEDEMLEMALRNSLTTTGAAGDSNGGSGSGSGSRPSMQDPDELTGSPAPTGNADEIKSKAVAVDVDVSPEAAAFARIAADRPHEEPANNPTTTTRIQFRHAAGRVIRRFAADDRVERIYEWLKAAPLEGREGQEFELKMMPQAYDLIGDLDKTVEEAGLKQATVIIEFIEG